MRYSGGGIALKGGKGRCGEGGWGGVCLSIDCRGRFDDGISATHFVATEFSVTFSIDGSRSTGRSVDTTRETGGQALGFDFSRENAVFEGSRRGW